VDIRICARQYAVRLAARGPKELSARTLNSAGSATKNNAPEEFAMRSITRRSAIVGAAALTLGRSRRALAAKNYDVGVTDSEIKLGTTSPYSGPASGFGVYGQAQIAYFNMVNDRGGINGRKVNLLSLDNAYTPPKTLEQTRKLVESDEVFAIAGMLGTSPNSATQKYLNGKKVPNLFLTSGAERFNDPKEFPWIVPFYPIYVAQSAAFGKYILKEKPDARIAVQYLNDDLGKDYLRGLKKGLGSGHDRQGDQPRTVRAVHR
jgi:branched-chain amino acid transport system substrate-binding protein